jgi:MarR-like DNA-binding transcriptional regulator SgrR of sgrS sRNA
MITRRELLGAALSAALVPRLVRGELPPPYGGRAIVSLTSAPVSLEPSEATTYAESTLTSLLYDGLYGLDAAGRIEATLASALPSVGADAQTARIPIRRGVLLHDGRELRAADVVASLKRAQERRGPWLAPVKRIARDGDVVVLSLTRPTPELAMLLATPSLAISVAGPRPLGTGPFRIVTNAAKRLELGAFADHFAGRPPLETLVLRWFEQPDEEPRAYEAGDLDVSLRGAVAFAGHRPKYPTSQVDGPATILAYLGFGNAHGKLFADVALRRAVSLAIGRQALRHLGSGERVLPVTEPESPDLGGRVPENDALLARPDEARRALAPRLGATRLELVFDRSRLDDAELATRIVAALDRAGAPTSFKALDPKEHARRVAAGQCDLHLGQLPLPSPDAALGYAAAFAAGRDGWAEDQLATQPLPRDVARAAFFARLPIVPLFFRAVRASHQTSLRGVGFDPLGRLGFADLFRVPA